MCYGEEIWAASSGRVITLSGKHKPSVGGKDNFSLAKNAMKQCEKDITDKANRWN